MTNSQNNGGAAIPGAWSKLRPLRLALWTCLAWLLAASALRAATPNVVLIYCDDLGYADIGPFGAKAYVTPNLDRLAREGRKFTRFYVSSPVCSASRAALMTGCYHGRVGIHGALGPKSKMGLNPEETTLAEVARSKGYATGMVGKWHLGDSPEFLPTRQGFDEWLGLPYSNDMWPYHPEARKGSYPALPLFDGERVIQAEVGPTEQAELPRRYAEQAVDFIRRNGKKPFFLYFAPNMPHVPLFAGEKFRGRSGAGLYGDVISEIDWSVGEILKALEEGGLTENTLVIFTSDNGPWLSYGRHAGAAGRLREGKGTCWEGGVRVPCLMRWPGRIPAGTETAEPLMTIDLLPTIARLLEAAGPARKIDGRDVWPLIAGQPGASNPHEAYYLYYKSNELHAVISGRWKLVLPHTYNTLGDQAKAEGGVPVKYSPAVIAVPELYDLAADEGETTNVAGLHRDETARLLKLAERMRQELGDSLTKTTGTGGREPGRLAEVK